VSTQRRTPAVGSLFSLAPAPAERGNAISTPEILALIPSATTVAATFIILSGIKMGASAGAYPFPEAWF
jgi:hypothetical protein